VVNPGRLVVVPDARRPPAAWWGKLSRGAGPRVPAQQPGLRHRSATSIPPSSVKAESDILCTSRTPEVVNFHSAGEPVLFLPDSNLGKLCQEADRPREHEDLGRKGTCIVHPPSRARRVAEPRGNIPAALVWRIRNARPSVLARPISSGLPRPSSSGGAASGAAEFIRAPPKAASASPPGGRWRPASASYFVANEDLHCSECPIHEAKHAREAARLPAHLTPRVERSRRTVRRALGPAPAHCWRST